MKFGSHNKKWKKKFTRWFCVWIIDLENMFIYLLMLMFENLDIFFFKSFSTNINFGEAKISNMKLWALVSDFKCEPINYWYVILNVNLWILIYDSSESLWIIDFLIICLWFCYFVSSKTTYDHLMILLIKLNFGHVNLFVCRN